MSKLPTFLTKARLFNKQWGWRVACEGGNTWRILRTGAPGSRSPSTLTSGPCASPWRSQPHLLPATALCGCTTIISIFQRRKQRHRGAKQATQGHAATQWQRWGLIPGQQKPAPTLLTSTPAGLYSNIYMKTRKVETTPHALGTWQRAFKGKGRKDTHACTHMHAHTHAHSYRHTCMCTHAHTDAPAHMRTQMHPCTRTMFSLSFKQLVILMERTTEQMKI